MRHYPHEIIQRKKETRSQMKGMQRKSEERDRGWISQSSSPLQILAALFLAHLAICQPIYNVSASKTDKRLNEKDKLQNQALKDNFSLLKLLIFVSFL